MNATHLESPETAAKPAPSTQLHGVSAEAWKQLCDCSELFKRLAPWAWMTPDECFGLRLPHSDPIAFVSIMGANRQNHACFAFLGWEALSRMQALMQAEALTVRDLIETPALQLTFIPLKELGPDDRAILQCAGPLPPADTLCAVFRSHRTGFLPWLLDAREVRQLTEIIRQTTGVAMRRENDPDLLKPPDPGLIWVRGQDADGHWQEQWLPRPPDSVFARPPQIDAGKLAGVAALPCLQDRVQFDLALSRATIGEPGHRLRTTYLLAAFNSDGGHCIGADVVLPTDGLSAMWRSVPNHLLDICLHAKSRPREIEVRSEQMMETLRPLLGQLPIKLTLHHSLVHFQTFLEGMNQIKTS